jgi:hypothetical protein
MDRRMEQFKEFIESQQNILDQVRTEISIPNPERHWLDMIFRNDKIIAQLQYDLIEKLGRM